MPPERILQNISESQTDTQYQYTTRTPPSVRDMSNAEPLNRRAPTRQQASHSFAQTQGVTGFHNRSRYRLWPDVEPARMQDGRYPEYITIAQNAAREAVHGMEQKEGEESDVEYDSMQQRTEQDGGYETNTDDDDVQSDIEPEEYDDEGEQRQELHDRGSTERLNSSFTLTNPSRRWRRARSRSLSDSLSDTDM